MRSRGKALDALVSLGNDIVSGVELGLISPEEARSLIGSHPARHRNKNRSNIVQLLQPHDESALEVAEKVQSIQYNKI